MYVWLGLYVNEQRDVNNKNRTWNIQGVGDLFFFAIEKGYCQRILYMAPRQTEKHDTTVADLEGGPGGPPPPPPFLTQVYKMYTILKDRE